MRGFFEKMGAYVFYRNRDCRIFDYYRDSDIIYYIVGDNIISVLNSDRNFYNNHKINIEKELSMKII